MPDRIPDLALMRERLAYDPETGDLIWKVARGGGVRPGDIAGCDNGHGYICVGFDGVRYMGHQIVWFLHYGEWPTSRIDHRDTNGLNNRIGNLRKATQMQNCMNQSMRSDNKSGLKGVSWHVASQRWVAQITIAGKKTHLGCFKEQQDAHAAYVKAANAHFGEFARAA